MPAVGGVVDGGAEELRDGGVLVDRGGQGADVPLGLAGPPDEERDPPQLAVDGRARHGRIGQGSVEGLVGVELVDQQEDAVVGAGRGADPAAGGGHGLGAGEVLLRTEVGAGVVVIVAVGRAFGRKRRGPGPGRVGGGPPREVEGSDQDVVAGRHARQRAHMVPGEAQGRRGEPGDAGGCEPVAPVRLQQVADQAVEEDGDQVLGVLRVTVPLSTWRWLRRTTAGAV